MYGQSRLSKAEGDVTSPDPPMTLLNVGFALKESSEKANKASTRWANPEYRIVNGWTNWMPGAVVPR